MLRQGHPALPGCLLLGLLAVCAMPATAILQDRHTQEAPTEYHISPRGHKLAVRRWLPSPEGGYEKGAVIVVQMCMFVWRFRGQRKRAALN